MSTLEIKDLHVSVDTEEGSKEILRGVTLTIRSGETHAIMGPNGSGKSTLAYSIAGHPKYTVTSGSVTLDGEDVLAMKVDERARAGVFLAMQYPVEVPGVRLEDFMAAALRGRGVEPNGLSERVQREAERLGVHDEFLTRAINDEFSGGEKKRLETLQLAVLEPKFAILDEIDSGLDVDALRAVSRRIEAATNERGVGVLAITHYSRLLHELRPDHVHVLVKGHIRKSGGPELAAELERTGYAEFADTEESQNTPKLESGDPFADPF
jgi:Fe-S cluster assembly ATP-binding protein